MHVILAMCHDMPQTDRQRSMDMQPALLALQLGLPLPIADSGKMSKP